VDKIAKCDYEQNLEENINDIISAMKTFSYKPKAVRRVNIPKGNGKTRPLGIPSYEDKLVQGVMADILSKIYEPKFCENSHGFRPNRSCHIALKELNFSIMKDKIGYVVDADIKGFFDNINQEWLIKFLRHDIADEKFIRYVKRFLRAGIMEEWQLLESDKGTSQGGLISPILANVYLHYVLDLWFDSKIKSKFKGATYMVRYADDFVCCFQYEGEANRFYEMLKERLEKFGLNLADDKSRIIKLVGHYRLYGVNDNIKSLLKF